MIDLTRARELADWIAGEACGGTNWSDKALQTSIELNRLANEVERLQGAQPAVASENPYAHSKNHASVWQAGFEAGRRAVATAAAPTEPAQQAGEREALLTEFERASHRKGELWERCQGKGWPEVAAAEFRRLRDERIPELRKQLSAALSAPASAQEAPARITEEQHIAAVKVLLRANRLDGLPQRMLDAMRAAAPAQAPQAEPTEERRQLQHLLDDIVEQADQDGLLHYRIRDGKDLLFSNMVSACAHLLAHPTPAEPVSQGLTDEQIEARIAEMRPTRVASAAAVFWFTNGARWAEKTLAAAWGVKLEGGE
jgi:hypothetical protein